MTITCPQCKHKNPDDAEFCENCGAQLPLPVPAGVSNTDPATLAATPASATAVSAPDGLVCPVCTAPYTIGDVFCFNCGSDLSKLPANHPGGAVASASSSNNSASANPVAPVNNGTAAAPVTPAAKDTELSGDDWDKAFANPATSGSATSPTTTPPAAVADPVIAVAGSSFAAPIAPVVTPAGEDGSAFGTPVATSTAPTPTPVAAIPSTLHLQVAGPYGEEKLEYKGQELLLGRQDAKTRVFPDVNLDDSAASRRHVSIWKEANDGFFYVQDLESSNGTSLNGRDLEPGSPTRLNDGDVIKIGTRYSIQVRIN